MSALALFANLWVMVVKLDGHETFVSGPGVDEGQQSPSWPGQIDVATNKIEPAVATVAIFSMIRRAIAPCGDFNK